MSIVADDADLSIDESEWDRTRGRVGKSADDMSASARQFAAMMVRAFAQASSGGKQFDDVLKSLALNLSKLAAQNALKPLARDLASGLQGLFNNGAGNVTPFASGGVIGAPTYFPLAAGGFGLAGEAGPEAIMPLARGPDGRLGVAGGGSGQANITVHIATPDADSFRRSETYLTGQIARAVARGQRNL